MYATAKLPQNQCAECFSIFEPKSIRHRFCTETCKNRQKSRKYRADNKKDLLQKKKEYHRKNPQVRKKAVLKMRYGVTPEFIAKQTELQEAKCGICRKEKNLVIDHCHSTGEYRGLLCQGCNTGLGRFNDNVAGLKAAIAYLEKK